MMEEMFNFVHYKIVRYSKNTENGKFEKQSEKIDFPRLPFELWIEATREERFVKQGANEVITGRIKNGVRLFYTGLRPISENYFYGDDYKKSKGEFKKSLCVFWLSEDFKTMIVYYFNNYYKQNTKEREDFIQSFIQSLPV